MFNDLKSQNLFSFVFTVLSVWTILVFISGCQVSSSATPTPTPAPPVVTLKIVTIPAPPAVTLEIIRLTSTPAPATPLPIIAENITPTLPLSASLSEAAFSYLHTLAANGNPRLFDSYIATPISDDGDTAWTYDNSLVLLALLARGNADDLATARTLADALVYAQNHDPDFEDGRLRDAYHANAFIRTDDKVNVDRGGSATGNMAWATLALVRAWDQLGDEADLAAAQRLGQWIFDHTYDERGAGGYTGGLAEDGSQFSWKATEHNADVYAAFMNLYQATGDPLWRERAMAAKRFLRTMWDEEGGFFWTGTTGDGVTTNYSPIPEDAQSWTLLVLGEPERYGRALVWANSTLYYGSCPACDAASGYRFSNTGSGCWWEGTAHMALAWQLVGESTQADSLLQSLRSMRLSGPQAVGEIIPAACEANAVTGYGWDYPAQVPHLGATAWYLFAELAHNPFWGLPVAEPIPFAGIDDEVKVTNPAPSDFQKGLSFTAWWQGLYSTPEGDQALAELASTGAEWVALIVTCYQETYLSPKIICNLPRTPTDEDLIHAIQTAHHLGLKVMLKPHIDLNQDPDHWRGDIGRGFTTEAEWQTWFTSYQAIITHYGTLAQAHGVEQFSVGTELAGTSHREADWRRLIKATREIYTGPLVYASNHGGEEGDITWWDAVDYIGIDAYYPLTAKDDPTLVELKAAWEQPIATMKALHERYEKPIILTEIGYRSIDGANRQPWRWDVAGEVDLQEQTDSYRAALESLWGQPWLAGIYWWNWDTNPEQGGLNDTDFTPHNKPAESVLQSFYKLKASEPN